MTARRADQDRATRERSISTAATAAVTAAAAAAITATTTAVTAAATATRAAATATAITRARAAATTTAAAISAATAITTATAAATLVAGPGLVDGQITAAEILAVEAVHRVLATIGHLNETEAAGSIRLAVHDDLCRKHLAVAAEQLVQLIRRRVVRQVSDVKLFGHGLAPCDTAFCWRG